MHKNTKESNCFPLIRFLSFLVKDQSILYAFEMSLPYMILWIYYSFWQVLPICIQSYTDRALHSSFEQFNLDLWDYLLSIK